MRKAVLFLSAFLVVSGSLWANTISVDEYVRQVRANSLRTEGRTFTIRGTLHKTWFFGSRLSLTIRGYGEDGINFFLLDNDVSNHLGITVGDVITFTGVSANEIWLEDASILEVERSSVPFHVAPSYTVRELTEQVLTNILRFHGEVVQTTVRVGQVSRAYNGVSIYVSEYGLSFHFSSAHLEALSNLNAGDMVTIRTRVSATRGGFEYFVDSELVPNP